MPDPAGDCLIDGCDRPAGGGAFCPRCLAVLPPALRRGHRLAAAALAGLTVPPEVSLRGLVRAANAHMDRGPPFWVVDVTDPDAGRYVWLNREWRGHPAHPLANPFVIPRDSPAAAKIDVIDLYEEWLDLHPDKDALFMGLYHETLSGTVPLGCGCGTWLPGQTPVVCHAVVLAIRLNRLHSTGEI